MEIVAIVAGAELPGQQQWQIALARLGSPWRFEGSSRPDAGVGFCPMRAGKIVSGVEILNDTLDALPDHEPISTPHRVLVIRWGGDVLEYACALTAAAALAEMCNAAIHDPAERPTWMDPVRVAAEAARATDDALAQNRHALTVEKVVRAISTMPEMGWQYVVDRRVVCRSVEGCYLRGLHVDRTSSPGVYRLRAMQTPWCMIDNSVYLNHAIELWPWRGGGLDRIVDSVRQTLATDDGIRQCIFADPDAAFIPDPRFYNGEEHDGPHPWVERAIMRAQDGDGVGALPLLRRAMERYPTRTNPTSEHPWRVVPEIVACVERGEGVDALLTPLAESAKARLRIQSVRRRDKGS